MSALDKLCVAADWGTAARPATASKKKDKDRPSTAGAATPSTACAATGRATAASGPATKATATRQLTGISKAATDALVRSAGINQGTTCSSSSGTRPSTHVTPAADATQKLLRQWARESSGHSSHTLQAARAAQLQQAAGGSRPSSHTGPSRPPGADASTHLKAAGSNSSVTSDKRPVTPHITLPYRPGSVRAPLATGNAAAAAAAAVRAVPGGTAAAPSSRLCPPTPSSSAQAPRPGSSCSSSIGGSSNRPMQARPMTAAHAMLLGAQSGCITAAAAGGGGGGRRDKPVCLQEGLGQDAAIGGNNDCSSSQGGQQEQQQQQQQQQQGAGVTAATACHKTPQSPPPQQQGASKPLVAPAAELLDNVDGAGVHRICRMPTAPDVAPCEVLNVAAAPPPPPAAAAAAGRGVSRPMTATATAAAAGVFRPNTALLRSMLSSAGGRDGVAETLQRIAARNAELDDVADFDLVAIDEEGSCSSDVGVPGSGAGSSAPQAAGGAPKAGIPVAAAAAAPAAAAPSHLRAAAAAAATLPAAVPQPKSTAAKQPETPAGQLHQPLAVPRSAASQQAAPMVLNLEDLAQSTVEVLELELERMDVQELEQLAAMLG